MVHALTALLATALASSGATAPRCSEPAPASDYMYTFTSTGDRSDHPTSGTVRVHGDRMRIDLNRKNSDRDEYILITDNGKQMMSVHPDRREVDEISAPTFEHIIGVSLKAVSPIVKFRVSNAHISSGRVGTGQKVLGYSTEQIRITESFDMHVVALGFDGGTEHHTIVTDYWVSPGLELGSNPLLSLLEHTASAVAQTDADFVQNEETVRARALEGTPLRTVVRESTVDDKGKRHESSREIDITGVNIGPQSPGLFQVPSGYRIKSGMNFSS